MRVSSTVIFVMRHRISSTFSALLIAFVSVLSVLGGSIGVGQEVDFETQIKPIFEQHCIACHGPSEDKSFRIDDRDATLSYLYEGEAEESDLYLVLVSEEEGVKMPPSTGRPLTEDQITLVKTWINEGAVWPEDVGEFEDVPLPDKEAELPFRALGSLHPAAVHLPIGLLMAAGLFAFLSLRGNFVMSDCAYYCLWLGALGAIFACASGWYFSWMEGYGTVDEVADILDQDNKMFWHRITGLGATAFAIILALFAASARNRDPDDGILWKLGLILLAAAIGFVGHKGGELTHGEDHYKDVEALIQSFLPEETKEDGDRTIDDEDSADSESAADADVDSDLNLENAQPLTTET